METDIELVDAEHLFYSPIRHPRMLIDGLLTTGLTILSGDPKTGKSWLVLMLCLHLASGTPVWGLPAEKTDVVYLALEDKEWRIQDRLQKMTEEPPDNLFFGFSCGRIGGTLEKQIRELMNERPDTGIIFIDTLQMVRDNVSGNVNAYAKDYKDISSLKQLADSYGICIFLVHHNRKQRDSANPFNQASGSSGIMGVPDTFLILQKEEHYSSEATLFITGRDIEERQMHLEFRDYEWKATGEEPLSGTGKKVPAEVFDIAGFILDAGNFTGTVTELLERAGIRSMSARTASAAITRYHYDVFEPLGIRCERKRTAGQRIISMSAGHVIRDGSDADDDDDAGDAASAHEELASLRARNGTPLGYPQTGLSDDPSWQACGPGETPFD